MTDERLQQLWQSEGGETTMSLDEIRMYTQKLERRIAWRNGREYVAAVVGAGFFGYAMWTFPSMTVRVACGLILAGAAFIVYHIHTYGSVRPRPQDFAQDFGAANGLEFLRNELVRQRDLLRRVFWWYEAPLLPGMVLFAVGIAAQAPKRGWVGLLAALVWVAAVFVGIHLLNARAAAKIQQRIDQLPRPD
jgi:hypothetical protein